MAVAAGGGAELFCAGGVLLRVDVDVDVLGCPVSERFQAGR